MSTDDEDGAQRDPLLETALRLADASSIDWPRLRTDLPDEARTVRALEALAEIGAAHDAPGVAAPPPAFTWGRLEAREIIGRGSYGDVWSAWDPGLDREVALKLRREPGGARRWLQEARRLAQVRHANVVTVHGADEHDGRAGLWMDRLHGRTLEDVLAVLGPVSAREAAGIGADLCAALAAVHAAGLVHGDLKTRNVLREGAPGHPGAAGHIVLMDFGSTRESTARDPGVSESTPLFTAPEVLRGGAPSVASDLYALGVVLYRIVTGAFPLEARTLAELEEAHARGAMVPLRARRPDLPPGFVAVVERALAADPAARFADAAAMERAHHGVLGVEPAPRHRAGPGVRRVARPAAIGVAALALVALAVLGPRWVKPWLAARAPSTLPSHRVAQEWIGTSPSGNLGQVIAGIGDWTGDGVPDLAVAALGEDEDRGAVYGYAGGDSSLAPAWRLAGEARGDRFGESLCASADFDGDGHRDLVVGAPKAGPGEMGGGLVYVYRGGPAFDGRPARILSSRRGGQGFGSKIGAAGDVNGDRVADLLVAAPSDGSDGTNAGRVYLFAGGAGLGDTTLLELALGIEGAQLGSGGALGIGDFNADGHDDFALGALYAPGPAPRAGRVLVYFGGPSLDATPDLVLRGQSEDDFFGDLHAGGDLNGDGHPDLVVGAFRADGLEPESGCASVYFGGPRADARADLTLRGTEKFSLFGRWATLEQDLDGDGCDDLVVGSPGLGMNTDSTGAITVYRGGRAMDDVADLVVRGSGARTGFGISPAALGDVQGDGLPDIAVGGAIDSRGVKHGGSVHVFDFARHHVVLPRRGDPWNAGKAGTVEWLGPTRADVSWSADGGRTWTVAARRAGGAVVNQATVNVPAAAAKGDSLRLRIAASETGLAGRPAEVTLAVRRASGGD